MNARKEQGLLLLAVLLVHALILGLLVTQKNTLAPTPLSIELSLAAADKPIPQRLGARTPQISAPMPMPQKTVMRSVVQNMRPQSQPTQSESTASPDILAPASASVVGSALATASRSAMQAPASSLLPTAPAVPTIMPPNSDAAYLTNPKPGYPPLSRRLGEQGVVTLSVLVGDAGQVQQLDIAKSSGYSRLDEAARKAVSSWRFAPGKQAGVAQAMWVKVPISFILEK